MIRSFSGAHPYRPSCLAAALADKNGEPADSDSVVDDVAYFTRLVDAGTCPRCGGPALPEDAAPGRLPAGSRATRCRCVPVCDACAGCEPFFGVQLGLWTLEPRELEDERARRAELLAEGETALLADGYIVTSEGSAEFEATPEPGGGGWAEFGYDNDENERRG